MRPSTWIPSFGVIALAALGACGTPEGAPDPANDASLRRMENCDDLKSRLSDVITEQLVTGYYGYRGGVLEDGAEGAPSDNAAGGDGDAADAPDDFTGTNNQEAGVDELDLVKTNGTHMFVAQDRSLHIVKSWPAADTEKLATLALDGWATGLFLVGDRAVVFTQLDQSPFGSDGTERSWYPSTRVTVIDVSDPAAPTVERTVDVDGWVADARLVGDDVTFVLNQYMALPNSFWELVWSDQGDLPAYPVDWEDEEAWSAAEDEARARLAPQVAALVASLDLDTVLPRWRQAAGESVESMYACEDLYAPAVLTPLSMLSVVQLDTKTGDLGSTGLMSDGWTIYASSENLYVAQTSQWWWGFEDEGKSHIHKFSLQSGSEPAYLASGVVDGWLYDQFAMSEYEGHLRVATTDLTNWWMQGEEADVEEPANNVFVLKDDGAGDLGVVGHVGGLGPNERIYAARMMGDKGYVVTFRQTDPLFTLDLSDPTNPRVVGELHMPGYSAYLHPMDDDHLLAVGMAGLETGELTGLAVTVFDVSDLANPSIAAQHEVAGNGWAWSEALWDHHAFTFHRDTLTIPAFTESYDEVAGTWSGFSGTISFRATTTGISELGRVDHRELVAQSECLWQSYYGGGVEGDVGVSDGGDVVEGNEGGDSAGGSDGSTGSGEVDPVEPPDDGGDVDSEPGDVGEWDPCGWDNYWYAQVRRSVYIEDNLYTISNYGVRVNDLTDPSISIADVVFFPEESPAE